MNIDYRVNEAISTEQLVDVLRRSTLGERRPLDDRECMAAMVKHASLIVTAWDGLRLVGVARALTDFRVACFLSELAVDVDYQRRGIGKQLLAWTRRALDPRCKIRLISAPGSENYYPAIGFVPNRQCWELRGEPSE